MTKLLGLSQFLLFGYLVFGLIKPQKALFFIGDEKNRKRLYVILAWLGLSVFFAFLFNVTGVTESIERSERADSIKQANINKTAFQKRNIEKIIADSTDLSQGVFSTNTVETMNVEELGSSLQHLASYANIPTNDSLSELYKTNKQYSSAVDYCIKRASEIKNNNLPSMRKRYTDILKDKLWEDDIDVQISGKNSTILTLVGAVFAANKNKKEMQEAIGPVVTQLGFKQIRYKWIQHDDEYTYYDIK